MKEKTKNIIGMTLLVLFIVGIIVAIYFFGITGIFVILGVQYHLSSNFFLDLQQTGLLL